MSILPDLSALSNEQLIAIVMAQRSMNNGRLTLKVNDQPTVKDGVAKPASGSLSCYGLGRFPITLYRSQWERLLSEADRIKAFILANSDKLTTKN